MKTKTPRIENGGTHQKAAVNNKLRIISFLGVTSIVKIGDVRLSGEIELYKYY